MICLIVGTTLKSQNNDNDCRDFNKIDGKIYTNINIDNVLQGYEIRNEPVAV